MRVSVGAETIPTDRPSVEFNTRFFIIVHVLYQFGEYSETSLEHWKDIPTSNDEQCLRFWTKGFCGGWRTNPLHLLPSKISWKKGFSLLTMDLRRQYTFYFLISHSFVRLFERSFTGWCCCWCCRSCTLLVPFCVLPKMLLTFLSTYSSCIHWQYIHTEKIFLK